MPMYLGSDDQGVSSYSLQDFEPSFGAKMNAAVRESWLESYGPVATDWARSRFGGDGEPRLSSQQAMDYAKSNGGGIKLNLTPKDGQYTQRQWATIVDRQRELAAVKDVRERTPWDAGSILRGGAMFGAGIVDPLNVATAFVPWTRMVGAARSLRAATMAESAFTRAGARAGLGALDAGISTAVLEPAFSFGRNELGDDYSAMDSIANIAFGTAFGGGLHVLGGAAGDAFKSWRGRASPMITPNPTMETAAPLSGAVIGPDTKVKVGDVYEPARWSVVEADTLQATVDKADNQFRDRSRPAYQAEIQSRANALDPALVLGDSPVMDIGAPTLATDGRIVGGNGRTLFISKAYEIGKGGDYRAALEARLADLGIDVDAVRGMKKPVLVRQFTRDVDVKKAAMLSNEGGATDMSPLEQAKVDAERLGDARLSVSSDGDINNADNRAAIRKWVEAQPENKRNSIMDSDGKLSPEGLRRLNGAMLFKAYGDSPVLARLIEAVDPGSRNLALALGRTAPVVANSRSAIAAGDLHPLDIAADLQAAVEKYNQIRADGMKVSDYMAQLDAFGDGLTPEATMLLDFMGRNIQSPRRIMDAITGFADRLNEAGNPKQADMFGESPVPDKSRMLQDAIASAEERIDSAEEIVASVSPETREAALRASVAQSLDGRNVDVEAIIGMDPDRATHTVADAEAAADRNFSPSEVAVADVDASAAVQQRLDAAPKWDGVKDAQAAMAEADALLADTVKAGDDAFKYSRGKAPGQKKATVWQGTTARFAAEDGAPLGRFNWKMINSEAGEQAQAVGYGHYVAQQAWISQTRYRERLIKMRGESKADYAIPDGVGGVMWLNAKANEPAWVLGDGTIVHPSQNNLEFQALAVAIGQVDGYGYARAKNTFENLYKQAKTELDKSLKRTDDLIAEWQKDLEKSTDAVERASIQSSIDNLLEGRKRLVISFDQREGNNLAALEKVTVPDPSSNDGVLSVLLEMKSSLNAKGDTKSDAYKDVVEGIKNATGSRVLDPNIKKYEVPLPDNFRTRVVAAGGEEISGDLGAFILAQADKRRGVSQTLGLELKQGPTQVEGANVKVAPIDLINGTKFDAELQALHDRGVTDLTIERPGSLYKAEMSAEDFSGLMLWDEKMSEQPAKVRAAFESWGIKSPEPVWVDKNGALEMVDDSGRVASIREDKLPPIDDIVKYLKWEISDAPAGSPASVMIKFKDGSVSYFDSMADAHWAATREYSVDTGLDDGAFSVTFNGVTHGKRHASKEDAINFAEKYWGVGSPTGQSMYKKLTDKINESHFWNQHQDLPMSQAAWTEVESLNPDVDDLNILIKKNDFDWKQRGNLSKLKTVTSVINGKKVVISKEPMSQVFTVYVDGDEVSNFPSMDEAQSYATKDLPVRNYSVIVDGESVAEFPSMSDAKKYANEEIRWPFLVSNGYVKKDFFSAFDGAVLELEKRRGISFKDDDFNNTTFAKEEELASIMLHNAGVPGHAFLDGASRGDTDLPAYNLVLYSDDVAKIMDRYARQTGEVLRGTDDPAGLTEALRLSFGKSTDALIETGGVKIVATPDDLPFGPHPGDVKGFFAPDGVAYIVASNVSELEARGMLLHEVGVHAGMEKMLGADVFQSVLRELDDAIGRGEDWAQAARDRVPADTPAGLVREEQLAYLVQHAPELPLVQRIIAAVRAWAYRTFDLAREKMTLSEGDFRAMAVAALHEAARGNRVGVLAGVYSRSVDLLSEWFRNTVQPSALRGPMANGDVFARIRHAARTAPDGPLSNYELRMVRVDEVSPSQFGEDYNNDASSRTASSIKAAKSIDEIRDADVLPIIVTKNMKIRDGNHRHAAAIANGETMLPALVEVGPGTGEVINLQEIERAYAAAETPLRYSRGETQDTSTTKDELKPYNDAVKRAKGYASVLRSAADKLENDAQAAAAMRAAMPDITPQEITDLLDQLRRQVKGLRGMARAARDALGSEDKSAMLQDDAMHAADTLANNLELAAVIEKRNASLNINVRLKASSYINQFREAGLDFEGFRGLLVGTERKRAGGRVSVEAEQKNYRGEWLGGMIADLEKGDLMRHFTSGEFDRDVYKALYNLAKDGAGNENLPKEAVAIAEIVNKYQGDARNTRNRFGAWIRDLQGYIVRQSHDMFKIREAGEKAYKEAVLPLLDVQRSLRDFDGSVDDFLTRVYDDFAAGSHMKTPAGEDDLQALGRGSSLARRESQSRVLYFKDGDAAYQYNDKFGQGRLAESVLGGLDHAAKSAGLLKLLGTNPRATAERLFDEYAESLRGDPNRRAKFLAHRKELDNLISHIDGTANIPGNATAAQVSSFFRAWQTMAKLGGMMISSVTDLTNYAAELRFGQDKNLLSGTLDGIGALTSGRAAGEKRAVLNSLGVFHESTLGAVFARFDSPELMGGKTSWAMQQFFKLTGINWWTESLRDGYALQHSSYVSSHADRSFDKLPAALRDMLGLYNIDAGKWDVLRLANTTMADGRKYITPDGLRTVPRAALENYITQVGRTVTDAAVANLQDDLSSALRTMTIDRMHHAVIEPGARTRAFMLRGTQPGTVPGEMLRFVSQFKSFPVALVQMTLGREVYGRGYDTIGQYLKNGKGDMVGLASFIALSTAMGYAAMSAKDLLRGKNPRPVDDPRTWAAAMVQGGGLGIYGDFLFGKYNRTGGSLSGSMAGPVVNLADTAADLWTRIRTGDDFAATAFNAALANTPFANLFYTRVAMDYLILHRIQESLNPGFLRRMEARAKRENDQTFFLPPSQVAR